MDVRRGGSRLRSWLGATRKTRQGNVYSRQCPFWVQFEMCVVESTLH